ncbi:MAG: hypothetical protein ACTTJ6_05915 [Treponema sp.]
MLYNIAFQDNIYVLLRQITTLSDGLKLDIDERLFSAKVSSDLIFFDKAINRLFEQIYPQSSIQNFIDLFQGLHFCISRYIDLINYITSSQQRVRISIEIKESSEIIARHKEMLKKIEEFIEESDPTELENELVSQNELACLLNA